MTIGRRRLVFKRLDDVILDVEQLLRSHRTVGRWTLGQICNHLACSLRFSVEGFPDPPAPWLLRSSLGRLARWSMLYGKFIPEGIPAPARYLPAQGLDDLTEAENLRDAVAAFNTCIRPKDHPLVGPMTIAEWRLYHCTHCAHHLSFAVPANSTS